LVVGKSRNYFPASTTHGSPQVFDELTKEERELTTILDQSIRWRIVGKPAISTGNSKTAKRQDKGQAYTI
jgi:hypothetical protein